MPKSLYSSLSMSIKTSYHRLYLTRLLRGLNALMYGNYLEKSDYVTSSNCTINILNFHVPPKCPLLVKEKSTQPVLLRVPKVCPPRLLHKLVYKARNGQENVPFTRHDGASL